MIRELRPEDAETCDAIIASLPDWFGNAQGLRDCAEAVRSHSGFVSEEGDEVVAFLTYNFPRPTSAEITWMAVRADRRRGGHGREMIAAFEEAARAEGARLFLVKTLSDLDPDPGYLETLAFYEAMGFIPATNLDIWGSENLALLLVKPA